MPLDPRARRFLDLLAATNPPSALNLSVAERRAALGHMMGFSGPLVAVGDVKDCTLPGPAGRLPARLYTPFGYDAAPRPGLVYFHGGGLVAGSVATHDAVARSLANAGACRVLSVDYRLAPEFRFPAAIDDAVAAVLHVCSKAGDFGMDAKRIGVCGDSAGGTLAASVCQSVARSGGPQLALQLLLCPILDYAGTTESRRSLGQGYLVDEATLSHDLLYYIPADTDVADPRVSPLRALDLTGLPRTAIHAAEFDPLRDEAKAYAERLAGAGTPATYSCHAGMIHLFYAMAGVIPAARTAFEQIGADIRAAFLCDN